MNLNGISMQLKQGKKVFRETQKQEKIALSRIVNYLLLKSITSSKRFYSPKKSSKRLFLYN